MSAWGRIRRDLSLASGAGSVGLQHKLGGHRVEGRRHLHLAEGGGGGGCSENRWTSTNRNNFDSDKLPSPPAPQPPSHWLVEREPCCRNADERVTEGSESTARQYIFRPSRFQRPTWLYNAKGTPTAYTPPHVPVHACAHQEHCPRRIPAQASVRTRRYEEPPQMAHNYLVRARLVGPGCHACEGLRDISFLVLEGVEVAVARGDHDFRRGLPDRRDAGRGEAGQGRKREVGKQVRLTKRKGRVARRPFVCGHVHLPLQPRPPTLLPPPSPQGVASRGGKG